MADLFYWVLSLFEVLPELFRADQAGSQLRMGLNVSACLVKAHDHKPGCQRICLPGARRNHCGAEKIVSDRIACARVYRMRILLSVAHIEFAVVA